MVKCVDFIHMQQTGFNWFFFHVLWDGHHSVFGFDVENEQQIA